MSMHLVRGMSTLSTKKRKRNRAPGWEKAQMKHDQWLMDRGVHPSQLKDKEKSSGISIPDYASTRSAIQTSDRIMPIAGRSEQKVYTGTFVRGIATLHKSNMVPVTSGEDAKEIARMRRG